MILSVIITDLAPAASINASTSWESGIVADISAGGEPAPDELIYREIVDYERVIDIVSPSKLLFRSALTLPSAANRLVVTQF